jgi:hypothetical protein
MPDPRVADRVRASIVATPTRGRRPGVAVRPHAAECARAGIVQRSRMVPVTITPEADARSRLDRCSWDDLAAHLDEHGWARIERLLAADTCADVAALYDRGDALFRSHVVMARHGFGRGEYKYFAAPLPPVVAALRAALYPRLAPIANRWQAALGPGDGFPSAHDAFLARCHAAGQLRPTPLLLRYGPGDFNALHQDLYGPLVFPLQVAVLLSRPGEDFSGGEFVLTEQRPRLQSRAEVVPLAQGDAVIFAVHHRPVRGTRGVYRVTLRHGVSRVRTGQRHTLGVIFHDAA